MHEPPSLAAPVELHKVDKATLSRMRRLVTKIARRAALDGEAEDMLLRVYLAGLYHGARAMLDAPATNPS